jgi:ribonucleoside-triphosphate reductase (formate)
MEKKKCGEQCQVFTRVVGYFRPVKFFNLGKKEEFKQRKVYDINKSMENAESKKQV